MPEVDECLIKLDDANDCRLRLRRFGGRRNNKLCCACSRFGRGAVNRGSPDGGLALPACLIIGGWGRDLNILVEQRVGEVLPE